MTTVDKAYHERKIKNAVGWFFICCIAFVVLELLLIYLGIMKFTRPELDLPSSFVIIGLAGLYLLWQMMIAMFFRTPLPDTYRPIDRARHPEVSVIIEEITSRLNLPRPHGVYIAPGINAAVFCRPTMLSMLVRPKQELVIGENLPDVLTSDELRVILYHEFGHYVSNSLGKKTPIYVISQFSKSFTAVKETNRRGVWNNVINSQVALFSYFAFQLCSIIDRHYKPLAQGEELAADDVAAENMCPELLVRTLVKVSLLQHYHRYIQWVRHRIKLRLPDAELSRILLSLYHNHDSGVKSIPPAIRQRIERLMPADSAIQTPKDKPGRSSMSNSMVGMLLKLHPKYEEERLRRRSVMLKFHLGHKKHRLPWVDGTYQILLDGRPIGNGNFIKGFDFSIRTSPGKHIVSAYGISGIGSIPCEFECESGDSWLFDMDYNVHVRHGYYEIFVASSKIISRRMID